jgi:hypothetical protein
MVTLFSWFHLPDAKFGESTKKGYTFHPSGIWTRLQVPAHSIKVITSVLLPRISWPPFSFPLYKRRNTSRHQDMYNSKTRCGSSGMDLRLNFARTSTFRESFFIRICPMWNALPLEIRTSERTSVFETRLKKLLFARLQSTFDSENTRTWHIICPICRSPNVDTACSCWLNILTFFKFTLSNCLYIILSVIYVVIWSQTL